MKILVTKPLIPNQVLIETYWNVNTFGSGSGLGSGLVLIETYWNVNTLKDVLTEELRSY